MKRPLTRSTPRTRLGAALLAALPWLAQAKPEVPPLAVSLSLRGEGLEHLNRQGSDLSCTGGTWTLDWSGILPGETASATALRAGDGMFFLPEGAAPQRPKMEGAGIRCTVPDGTTGRPVLAFEGRLTPTSQPTVDMQVSMATESPYVRIGLDDVAQCRVTLAQGQAFEIPVSFNISSQQQHGPGGTRFDQPLILSQQELENGFSRTWQLSSEGFAIGASQCLGQRMQGELTLRYKAAANDPQIEFNSCLHLAQGESRAVIARGAPEGGSYRFAASPRSLMDVTPIGGAPQQATVGALTPGRGEFTASYQLHGKTASKTVPASVVQLLGFDAPTLLEVGILDADGRGAAPVQLPFRSQPAAAGDLLRFTDFDAKLISVAPGSSALTIQGLRPGVTPLQAETLCGTKLGPIQGIKVVTCTQATREALERRKRGAKERNDAISRQVSELLGDAEFERVEKEIAEDVKNLAVKTAESIVGALSLGQGSRVQAAEQRIAQLKPANLRWLGDAKNAQQRIKMVTGLYDIYDTSSDMIEGLDTAMMRMAGEKTDAEAYEAAAKGVIAGLVKLKDDDRLGLAKSFIEAALAAQKMGRNLGVLAGVAEHLAELEGQHDGVRRDWERVARLIKRCNTEVAPEEDVELIAPPADPKPSQRPPPKTKPPATEIEVPPERTPAPPKGEARPPIEDPVKPPPTRVSLPLCQAAGSSPAQAAVALRRAQSAHQGYAERLQAAAQTAADGPRQVWQRLETAVRQGPASLRAQLPALKAAHDQSFAALAREGDAALAQLHATEACEAALPLGLKDLRRIEWHLGP